jgi:hypothetical protein
VKNKEKNRSGGILAAERPIYDLFELYSGNIGGIRLGRKGVMA